MTAKTIDFDIEDIKEQTAMFEYKFAALTTLQPGNKVGISINNNLYAEYFTNPYIMAALRKVTRQRRGDINDFLVSEFMDYKNLLLFVINAFENDRDNRQLKHIITTHKMLCVGLVIGLTNLKVAYPDYKPILDTCDKHIEEFNLFRSKKLESMLPFAGKTCE